MCSSAAMQQCSSHSAALCLCSGDTGYLTECSTTEHVPYRLVTDPVGIDFVPRRLPTWQTGL